MPHSYSRFLSKYFFLLSSAILIFSISLPNHLSPSFSFLHDYAAFLSLYLLFVGVFLCCSRLYFSQHAVFLIVLSIVPLLQWLFGVVFFLGDMLLVVFYLLGAAIALFCGANISSFVRKDDVLKYFAITFLVIGFINVFMCWYQFFRYDYLGMWVRSVGSTRMFANLGQPNNLATILVVSLLSSLYLFEKKLYGRCVLWLIILLLLGGIVLTQSRTSILVGIVFFGWYLVNIRRILFRVSIVDLLFIVFAYIFFLMIIGGLLDFYRSDNSLRDLSLLAGNARFSLWEGMFQALLVSPLWGYGWGQAGVAQVLSGFHFISIDYSEHSHNIFLDLLVWNGPILGCIIIAAVVFWLFKRVLDCCSIEHWFVLSVLGAIFIHGMLEFPLEYAFFLLPAFFLAGVISPFRKVTLFTAKWQFGSVIIVFGVLLYAMLRDYHIISYSYKQAKFENVGMLGVVEPLNKKPRVIMLSHWSNLIEFMRTDAEDIKSAYRRSWARKVAYRFAYVSSLYKYAEISYLSGDDSEYQKTINIIKNIYGEKGEQLINVYPIKQAASTNPPTYNPSSTPQ